MTWFVNQIFLSKKYFNSHAHVERDLLSKDISVYSLHFNSHAHVERDDDVPAIRKEMMNFNSHAHVERDLLDEAGALNFNISTHTLTWSVTRLKIVLLIWMTNFNSHAHVERD